jgi:tetratricopeptide (TPR) repeat protein
MLTDEKIARAKAHLRSGQTYEAARLLAGVAEEVHLVDRDYDEAMYLLAQTLASAQQMRAAATVMLYLRRGEEMRRLSEGHPIDMARACLARERPDPREAARHFRTARWPAHAAIACEKAGDFVTARALWDEVSGDPRLREDPYVAALVSFNLGRVLGKLGDDAGAHRCRVRAMRLLEEAADVLEARGLRDRAFDCFQVLLTLGIETGSFENLAEGYVNCIRILREDHLKYYALQYYEDFIGKAEAAGEHHAVATMLHEAADYARNLGLPFQATLRVREAQAWQRAADGILAAGGAAELAENALLAAISAYSGAGMHGRAVQLFRALAALPLDEKRTQRYRALHARFAEARDEQASPPPLPEYLKQPVNYPDIWNVDVIEWEEQGDAVEACGEILLDATLPSYVRRRALVARLVPLMSPQPGHPDTLAILAERLGEVQVYSVLAPLEHLFERGPARVRASVLSAARKLYFKRTFVVINRGVGDGDLAVRRKAQEAIAALHFPHAFDPLSRLHRDSVDPEVRRSALFSIGRIQSLEAVEYLIGVVAHGSAEERAMARDLLVRNDYSETSRALAAAIERESGEVQRALVQIRYQRGER